MRGENLSRCCAIPHFSDCRRIGLPALLYQQLRELLAIACECDIGLAAERAPVILEACHRSPKLSRPQRVQDKTRKAIAVWP
jgi:hypothetical protein